MKAMPADTAWSCPKCGADNVDNIELTSEPACGNCDHTLLWVEVDALQTSRKDDTQ